MVKKVSDSLDNRVIIVTGGVKGIGAAIVQTALAQGALVASFDIIDEIDNKNKEFKLESQNVTYLKVNVTSEENITEGIDFLINKFGKIDGLVNNAGRNSFGDATTMTETEWDSFMNLDLKAAWLCAKFALPHLVKNAPSAIVNISSLHSKLTAKDFFPYAAAKAGIIGLTKNLALDYADKGVRVNAVSPGYVQTQLAIDYFDKRPGEEDRVKDIHPMKRIGTPKEIAEVVCFLLSEKASFVTGADWAVDGGLGSKFA